MNLALEWKRLLGLLETGGPVVWLLLLMSLIAAVVIFAKLLQFASAGGSRRSEIERALGAWRQGEVRQALGTLEPIRRHPVADAVATAMQMRSAGVPDALVREEVTRVSLDHLERLGAHLKMLEVIGATSPLLGLLGTVLGMIDAFQALQQAGARVDPSILAGGIWQALLTTAAGLVVAIPVVSVLHWLERKLGRLRHQLQDSVTRVFTSGPAFAVTDGGPALAEIESAPLAADPVR